MLRSPWQPFRIDRAPTYPATLNFRYNAASDSTWMQKQAPMTTQLDKILRRQIRIKGQDYIVALSPEGLKLTVKGKRTGLELSWSALVSGDAALAVALNASVGRFAEPTVPQRPTGKRPRKKTRKSP
jgi:hypothetical protein